ncbi:Integral membrane protein 2B [Lamellibrachia satsuma]|nr:Integral membrane protein 2B [Lamellibrachia satsuma]
MTIYTGKPVEKKDEESNVPPPEVVEEPLMGFTKKPKVLPPTPALLTIHMRRRRNNFANICVLMTALIVLTTGVIGGIYLYKHMAERDIYRGFCGVGYYEYQDVSHHQRHRGAFEESIELDRKYGKYEKIVVPEFEESKKATILHDFEKNITAIVDVDIRRCFVLPLNRTLVKPPKDFWDLINKLKTGYYLPDSEAVRETYVVVEPPVHNLSPYGFYIKKECHQFDTFRLRRSSAPRQPRMMVKRAASGKAVYTFSAGTPVIIELETMA